MKHVNGIKTIVFFGLILSTSVFAESALIRANLWENTSYFVTEADHSRFPAKPDLSQCLINILKFKIVTTKPTPLFHMKHSHIPTQPENKLQFFSVQFVYNVEIISQGVGSTYQFADLFMVPIKDATSDSGIVL